MSSRPTGSTSAQPSDLAIEEMYKIFGQFKWGMTSIAVSKIDGPERSSTALHLIQT